MTAGFPADDYTPHGYLANPFAVARSWTDGEGGCLRSSREYLGFGWQLPWALKAQASVELVVVLEAVESADDTGGDSGRRLVRRADFTGAGLTSPHHSATLFAYRWRAFGRVWEARYTPVGRGELGLELAWRERGRPAATTGAPPEVRRALPAVTVGLALVGTRHRQPADGAAPLPLPVRGGEPDGSVGSLDLGEPFGAFTLDVDGGGFGTADPARLRDALHADGDGAGGPGGADRTRAAVLVAFTTGRSGGGAVHALARQRSLHLDAPGVESRSQPAGAASRRPLRPRAEVGLRGEVSRAVERAREADAAFWAGAARLVGDWPGSWRRGWVYDVETTRMCVFPAGGIFTDVWPAWMIQWPRAVVAEGTLDMARLAYAVPELAQRAVLSLFRDAPTPNVPCVFQHGEPNMVAADGSICGTSPAWCVPFYNLERLFALTGDRAWLAEVYPFLSRYVEWWLAERTDPDGWAVYKCTWEAGEDDTPRLDPERRGDNVVSAFVRPVELQATLAHAAGVLGRFATVLGEAAAAERWRAVEADYLERTRSLWDPEEERFRDWDARAGRFLGPSGEPNYWGVDVCRYSALAFTPALAGLTDDRYAPGLRRELQAYGGPPWTLWASWSYVVLEAALALGERPFAARVAAGIVGRVYAELDAREILAPDHPTPGVAREYWPLDLSRWASCEGYGWGANTASLLVRQIFGFLEGRYADRTPPAPGADLTPPAPHAGAERGETARLRFRMAPGLPADFLKAGRVYWLRNLPYRGAYLDLGYRVEEPAEADGGPAGRLSILVGTGRPTRCRVRDAAGRPYYDSGRSRPDHEIPVVNGGLYDVELTPAD